MTTHRCSLHFSRLPIGAEFERNGTQYKKRSTRTADCLNYKGWFYFGMDEQCVVSREVANQVINGGDNA